MQISSVKKVVLIVVSLGALCTYAADENSKHIQTMIFEGTTIQGELGNIKAMVVTSEERPSFSSLALQLDEGPMQWDQIPFSTIEHPQFRESFTVSLPK